MNLNLQILKKDLSGLALQGQILDDRLIRRLTHPVNYAGEIKPRGDCLYLVEADKLPQKMDFENRPSFICIGTPPENYLTSDCNVLYTSTSLSILELMNRVSELFYNYYCWEMDMQQINNRKLPLKALGELSHPIIRRPYALFEANFKTVFSIIDTDFYTLPETYVSVPDKSDYMSMDDINMLNSDPEFVNAADEQEPTIYSGKPFGYRTLYYNIRINGVYVARITVDEVGGPFTDRDFALIVILADAILQGMQQKDLNNLNQPRGLHAILERLLEHKMVPEEMIAAVLKENDWSIDDTYFCVCVEPTQYDKNNDLLSALAFYLSRINASHCHMVFHEKLVFVFNLSKSQTTRETIHPLLISELKKCSVKAGISSNFTDFKNLYYHFLQASQALTIGKKSDLSLWIYHFENYLLPFLFQKFSHDTIPEMICPSGLLKLLKYDEVKGTDYVRLLRIHLENNMSPAVTTRLTFLHRSTFLYRMEKITSILNMDLENPDTRLLLMMAFKFLDAKGSKN